MNGTVERHVNKLSFTVFSIQPHLTRIGERQKRATQTRFRTQNEVMTYFRV